MPDSIGKLPHPHAGSSHKKLLTKQKRYDTVMVEICQQIKIGKCERGTNMIVKEVFFG